MSAPNLSTLLDLLQCWRLRDAHCLAYAYPLPLPNQTRALLRQASAAFGNVPGTTITGEQCSIVRILVNGIVHSMGYFYDEVSDSFLPYQGPRSARLLQTPQQPHHETLVLRHSSGSLSAVS